MSTVTSAGRKVAVCQLCGLRHFATLCGHCDCSLPEMAAECRDNRAATAIAPALKYVQKRSRARIVTLGQILGLVQRCADTGESARIDGGEPLPLQQSTFAAVWRSDDAIVVAFNRTGPQRAWTRPSRHVRLDPTTLEALP